MAQIKKNAELDFTDQRFGKLVARSKVNFSSWVCECDCGKIITLRASNLLKGKNNSCGCLQYNRPSKKELAGKVFGKLTVQHHIKNKLWQCICSCGNSRITQEAELIKRGLKSCGCAGLDTQFKPEHGMYQTPEFITWNGTFGRCRTSPDYAGRGIKVCERWNDFATFYADMGPRPSTNHSLDRIDVDGDYSPENCRWATSKEQANNRTTTHYLELNGEKHSLTEWSEKLGISQSVIAGRLRRGWTVEKTLTEPVKTVHRSKRAIYYVIVGPFTNEDEASDWAKVNASKVQYKLKRRPQS